MMWLHTIFKGMNIDANQIDELVQLSAEGHSMKAEYERLGADVPEWLDDGMRVIGREIRKRMADDIDRQIRLDTARLDSLKTRDEKRNEVAARIDALKKKQSELATA